MSYRNELNLPLEVRSEGLYCKSGDFYIDAWAPVTTCVVTHAHSDHARPGHGRYLCTIDTAAILRYRLGPDILIETLPYGKKIKINDCWLSLHPAGHILGSAQVRIESGSLVSVVSGDYKRTADPTCEPFELVECDVFVTESTFGLPIYHWQSPEIVTQQILEWWLENQIKENASVLFCYSLGKAQRILSMLKEEAFETITLHGAILSLANIFHDQGVALADYSAVSENREKSYGTNLILAPPSAKGSPWMKRFFPYKTALASGWMQVRGTRRRQNIDRGFVLSDHADWPELLQTIKETKASIVLTTHGNSATLARYLQEQKINAYPLQGMSWIEEGEV